MVGSNRLGISALLLAAACSSSAGDSSSSDGPDETGGSATTTNAGGGGGDSTQGSAGATLAAGGSNGPSGASGAAVQGGGAGVGGGGGRSNGGGGAGGAGGGAAMPSCGAAMPNVAAPSAQWKNVTSNLAGKASSCQEVGVVAVKPCSNEIIAGISNAGLWATDDNGASWHALGTGAGSAKITNTPLSIVFDPAHTDVFWESGIHDGGGLYKTTDGGVTFKQLGTFTFGNVISVDLGDPDRKTLLAGIHGQMQQMQRSEDGGATFANVGANLPAGTSYSLWSYVLDAQTFLAATVGGGSGNAMFRSTDAGQSWTKTSDLQAAHDGGFLRTASGAMYIPFWAGVGLAKSTDLGKTWAQVTGPNTIAGVTPVELPDGTLAAIGADHLVRSSDGAKTWIPIGEPLPYKVFGTGNFTDLTYSVATKTFILYHADCGTAVLPDAIMSAGFDYAAQ